MRFFSQVSLLSLLIFLFFSCSKTSESLEIAEKVIETNPDSAQSILKNTNYNSLNDNNKALYTLLSINIYDKKNLDIPNENELLQVKAIFEKNGDNDHLAYTYYFIGRMYKYRLSYDTALKNYIKALDLIGDNKYLIRGRILSDIGDVFTFQKNYTIAITKYKEAYTSFCKAKDDKQTAIAIINMGKVYSFMGKYNLANNYIEKIIRFNKDTLTLSLAYLNYGINKFHHQDYFEAKSILLKSLNYKSIEKRRAFSYYYLADSYFELRQLDSAKIYALKVFDLKHDNVIKRECYRILANIAFMQNETPLLKKYMSLYQDYTDSIRKLDAQTKGQEIEEIHQTQKEVHESQSKTWITGLVSLLAIILSIGISLYLRKKMRDKIKQTEIRSKKRHIKIIDAFVKQKKKALKLSVSHKRSELTAKTRTNSPENIYNITFELYNEFLHLSNPLYFQNEANTNLNNLYTKLKSGYPDLNEKEIQWACMQMMDIPNEDSMILLGYNPEAYKKMKQRITKKINVSSVTDIIPFLNELMLQSD